MILKRICENFLNELIIFLNDVKLKIVFFMENLQRENAALRKKIEDMAEARNKEILDLQYAFAERIRELEKFKGSESSDKIAELSSKIVTLQNTIREKEKDIVKYEKQIVSQEKEIESGKRREKIMKDEIEKLKLELSKSHESSEAQIDISELISPLEAELQRLSDLVSEKQSQIENLQNVVHEECQERDKLLAIIRKQKSN